MEKLLRASPIILVFEFVPEHTDSQVDHDRLEPARGVLANKIVAQPHVAIENSRRIKAVDDVNGIFAHWLPLFLWTVG